MIQELASHPAVAILEDDRLVEFSVEADPGQSLVGNIYLGRVVNSIPGLQTAFVNVGVERNAFLYIDDAPRQAEHGHQNKISISQAAAVGDSLIVQVSKEAVDSKGPRVTSRVAIPGKLLVFLPTTSYVGVSRRISSAEERENLKAAVRPVLPSGSGCIVRTAAAGVPLQNLAQEAERLVRYWNKLLCQAAHIQNPPALLRREAGLVQRTLRDFWGQPGSQFLVSSRAVWQEVMAWVEQEPDGAGRDRMEHREGSDLFAAYGVMAEVERALRRKVWLKSGAYLVVDESEALTVIDVNTGKFTGRRDPEETVLKTNLEAAVEVARQLRLRNLGGVILVDFIDLAGEEHRQALLARLQQEVHKDRLKVNILGLTRLGLIEMTRKKERLSLSRQLQHTCPYCGGHGWLGRLALGPV